MSIKDQLKEKKNEIEKVEKESEELLRVLEAVQKDENKKFEEQR